MKVLEYIGNYFKNLFICIGWMLVDLFPYAFFGGTVTLLTYWLGGFEVVHHFEGPGGFVLFGVVAMIGIFLAGSYLGGVSGIAPTFSFMAGDGRWRDVHIYGSNVSITEHGAMGLAVIVINFFKCLIMIPLKLIKWLLLGPIFLLFGRDAESMRPEYADDGVKRILAALLFLVIAIVLACPVPIANSAYKKKYNVDDLKFNDFNYEYEVNYSTIWHSFEFTLYDPSAQLEYLKGSLIMVCDGEEYRLSGKDGMAKTGDKIRFQLRADPGFPDMFFYDLTPYLNHANTVLYFDLEHATYKSVEWDYNERMDGVSKHIPIIGDEKQIKLVNQTDPQSVQSSVQETKYQQALAFYEEGRYAEALSIFQSLGGYKESDNYSNECESKQYYTTLESELHRVAGINAILPDSYEVYTSYSSDYQLYYNGEYSYDEVNHIYIMERPFISFFCDLKVPSAERNTYLSNFVRKLEANGFSFVKTNTYRKGTTFIQFSDIQGGYINYYAFDNPKAETADSSSNKPSDTDSEELKDNNQNQNPQSPTEYTITYNLNGGVNNPQNPSSFTENDQPLQIFNPSKEGYHFDGWSDGTSSSKDYVIDDCANNITLSANWLAKEYSVTVDSQGGEYTGEASFSIHYDEELSIATPSRKGYDFNGWFVGSTKIEGVWNCDSAASVTLVAKWTADCLPYITYSSASGGGYAITKIQNYPKELLIIPDKINGTEVTEISTKAFLGVSGIKHIEIPSSVNMIRDYAFANMSNLQDVLLPNTVKLGEQVFYGCASLSSFTVPQNLQALGANVLTGCSSLKTFTTSFPSNYPIYRFFASAGGVTTWPVSLTKIVVTSGNKIPDNYFTKLPKGIELVFNEAIIEVGARAFMEAAEFVIPSTVKKIGSEAYASLGNIGDSITLPEGLQELGNNVFQLTYFSAIYLPSTLTKLGKQLFSNYNTNNVLKDIYYNGTKNQWLSLTASTSVSQYDKWNYGLNYNYKVWCNDAVYYASFDLSNARWENR